MKSTLIYPDRFSLRKTGSRSDTSFLTGLAQTDFLYPIYSLDCAYSPACPPSLQVQPLGWRPQRGFSHHRSVPGVLVAADGAVSLCLPVQREVPDHRSQPHLFLSVWKLYWQLSAGENRAAVSSITCCYKVYSSFLHRNVC